MINLVQTEFKTIWGELWLSKLKPQTQFEFGLVWNQTSPALLPTLVLCIGLVHGQIISLHNVANINQAVCEIYTNSAVIEGHKGNSD